MIKKNQILTFIMINYPYSSMNHSKTFFASSEVFPQNNCSALKPLQTEGLEGSLKMAHFKSSVSCMHLTPAGFPSGIPGIAELIDG